MAPQTKTMSTRFPYFSMSPLLIFILFFSIAYYLCFLNDFIETSPLFYQRVLFSLDNFSLLNFLQIFVTTPFDVLINLSVFQYLIESINLLYNFPLVISFLLRKVSSFFLFVFLLQFSPFSFLLR